MAYQFVVKGSTLRVVLQGAVDLAESAKLKEAFESQMTSDIQDVAVEGGFLEYIDSSGVAALLFMKKLCARHGARFAISAISALGARVIQLARLDAVLGMRADAVAVGASVAGGAVDAPVFDEVAARGALPLASAPTVTASEDPAVPNLTIQPGSFS